VRLRAFRGLFTGGRDKSQRLGLYQPRCFSVYDAVFV
jgi:hypothetical protein